MEEQISIAMAPMEGLTGYVYRRAHHMYFDPLDAYYTPFISNKGLSHRERQDVLPEHNEGMYVIPQILTNRADDFLEIEKQLYEYGYREVNLNLGCPSGTVAAKGRGAGFLQYPNELGIFLDRIFSRTCMRISIKTRIGVTSDAEWPDLLDLFNRFPLERLIVHPRLLKDFYRNCPRMDAYQYACSHSLSPLCYNGDVDSVDNWHQKQTEIGTAGQTKGIMLGRGLLSNPGLAQEICGKEPASSDIIQRFHDEILEGYCQEMSGDRNVLFKMKELWVYMGTGLNCSPKQMKQLKKTSTVKEYRIVSASVFRELFYERQG